MKDPDTHFVAQDDTFDVQQIIRRLKQYRWLFVGCVLLSVGAAYLYTRYSVPVYGVKASVLIEDEADVSETAELIYGTELLSRDKSLYNEIAVIKSYPFIYHTIQEVNPRVSIYEEGVLEDRELYTDSPFTVTLDTLRHNPANEGVPLQVHILSDQKFQIRVAQPTPGGMPDVQEELAFGEPFVLNGSRLRVDLQQLPAPATDRPYYFVVNNLKQVAREYKRRLEVRPYSQDASVVDISLKTSVPYKEIDFLNELVRQYRIVSLRDKNLSTTQSLNFIDEQLGRTYDTLQIIEHTLENFKSQNNFSEASNLVERNFDKIGELESEKATALVNKKYYQALSHYLQENRDLDQLTAPTAVGIQDVLLNSLIGQLVNLQIEKNTYLVEGPSKNPYLQDIEGKIGNIKKSLVESLENLLASNEVVLEQLNQRIGRLEREVSALPEAERRYINIRRLYDLNESVYTLLLQKKVEAGIARASATVDSKVIEPAYLESNVPIAPRRMRVMMMALVAGLLFPAGLIFLWEKLSTKVKAKGDITRYSDIVIIDSIGKNDEKCPLIVHEKPRHPVSESFRSLRSNLKFTAGRKEGCQVYLLTSTLSGEGKTFCSANLSVTLAQTDKKVLLLDADLRKEHSLHGFSLAQPQKGLSNYLVQDATLDEVICQTHVPNLEVIPSGTLPPNPSELLMTDALEVMMDVLRASYDYIVIDTAPVGLVSDALALMRFSSTNLHLVRQNFTGKDTVKQIDEIYSHKEVKNLNLLYNDVKASNENRYGYYQYGYQPPEKKLSSLVRQLRMFF